MRGVPALMLAGALVVPRTNSSPRTQVSGIGKLLHVRSGFGQQIPGRFLLDSRNRLQQFVRLLLPAFPNQPGYQPHPVAQFPVPETSCASSRSGSSPFASHSTAAHAPLRRSLVSSSSDFPALTRQSVPLSAAHPPAPSALVVRSAQRHRSAHYPASRSRIPTASAHGSVPARPVPPISCAAESVPANPASPFPE